MPLRPTLRCFAPCPYRGHLTGGGSLTLAQICSTPAPQTSHIPETLAEMLLKVTEDERNEEAL